jgi:CRP/FNR family cyclic AMP-dependent transcriptional regulator
MDNIFWSNIFKKNNAEIKTIARLWQNTPLFQDIPARHIGFLSGNMHLRNYKPEEMIFRSGDQGAGVIMVLEGAVKVMADKVTLAELSVGDFFGEIALAATDNRTADAYSVGNSTLVYFLKQDLEEWIEYEPRLGARFLMNLSSTLARRLYEANQLIAAKS